MTRRAGPEVAFVILGRGLPRLGAMLRELFVHPWVASYQIGFGPPLVRANAAVTARARAAKSALEKLDAYLELCVLAPDERARLVVLERRLTVRRLGAVDAEAVDEASAEALDLAIRLHHPTRAPPALSAELRAHGAPEGSSLGAGPDELGGRFLVRLADPENRRLLDDPRVAEAAAGGGGLALALELRVPADARELYAAWLSAARERGVEVLRVVELGDPVPHARVHRAERP